MQSNELQISEKFEPLFNLFDESFHPEVDTVIMTGGRYSLKSFTASIFALTALYNYDWNVLYTRFTNTSIVDSVKPEVSDKVELLGLESHVKDTNTHIEYNNSRIAFKGIKPGSKGQTANLKSLSGFNLFVNDEAEELPDFNTFKKIFYSIRQTNKRNLSILILNPTTRDHWIFKEFFEKKGLEGGENCIKDNVLYIHTSYLDADFDLMPRTILNDYNRMKLEDPENYENIVLGGWITEPEGVLLPKSQLKFANVNLIPKENIVWRFSISDPADTGGDRYSNIFIDVAILDGNIACYVKDLIHSTDGIEACVDRVAIKLKEHESESCFLEKNGIGLAAQILLAKKMPKNCQFVPYNAPSGMSKEQKILTHYEFVKRFFVFDEKYKDNKEYSEFIAHLTTFQKDGDNKHKADAIDVCCSATNFIKLKFHKLIFGT